MARSRGPGLRPGRGGWPAAGQRVCAGQELDRAAQQRGVPQDHRIDPAHERRDHRGGGTGRIDTASRASMARISNTPPPTDSKMGWERCVSSGKISLRRRSGGVEHLRATVVWRRWGAGTARCGQPRDQGGDGAVWSPHPSPAPESGGSADAGGLAPRPRGGRPSLAPSHRGARRPRPRAARATWTSSCTLGADVAAGVACRCAGS